MTCACTSPCTSPCLLRRLSSWPTSSSTSAKRKYDKSSCGESLALKFIPIGYQDYETDVTLMHNISVHRTCFTRFAVDVVRCMAQNNNNHRPIRNARFCFVTIYNNCNAVCESLLDSFYSCNFSDLSSFETVQIPKHFSEILISYD